MNRANGFVNVDVVLLAAGFIHGPCCSPMA